MHLRLDLSLSVTSQDRLVDTSQRLGARLGSTFVDGRINPRFGTCNITLPLQNGHYLEVVCPLNHPSSDSTPFGKAVSQRTAEGGGWLTWVVAVDDVSKIEKRLGRATVDGHRIKPDGKAILKIVKIEITGTKSLIEEWFGSELRAAIGLDVEVEWVAESGNDGDSGMVSVHVMTPSGVVRLD